MKKRSLSFPDGLSKDMSNVVKKICRGAGLCERLAFLRQRLQQRLQYNQMLPLTTVRAKISVAMMLTRLAMTR